MFCMKCGTQLSDDALFCSKCGFKLTNTPTAPASNEFKLNKLQCTSCSSRQIKKIRNGEFICESCGCRYFANNQDPFEEATEKELYELFVKVAEYIDKEDYDNELRALLEYKDKAWNNCEYLVKLGRAYRHVGYNSKALECYERAKEIKPDEATIYTNIGSVYVVNKEFSKAIPFYEQGISIMEKNPILYTQNDRNVAYGNYGLALAGSGRKAEGESFIRKAEANGYQNGDNCRRMAGLM